MVKNNNKDENVVMAQRSSKQNDFRTKDQSKKRPKAFSN